MGCEKLSWESRTKRKDATSVFRVQGEIFPLAHVAHGLAKVELGESDETQRCDFSGFSGFTSVTPMVTPSSRETKLTWFAVTRHTCHTSGFSGFFPVTAPVIEGD